MKNLTNNELISIIEDQETWDTEEMIELLDRAEINYMFDENPRDPDELFEEAKQRLEEATANQN